jgi:outer membrane protein assembly factor BamB
MESLEAYSTPVPISHNGREELLIAGGDFLTGHDPATGREIWRWGTWNPGHREMWWRLVPSPVAGAGVVLACAPKRAPVYAARLGGNGSLGEAGLAWSSGERIPISSDVPTPLFYKRRFYVLSDVRRALTAVNPQDGKPAWTTELPSICWGSPTGADGKIYCLSLQGEVFVIDAATGRIAAANAMAPGEDDIRSTVAVAGNCLFIRTNQKLYCIGK